MRVLILDDSRSSLALLAAVLGEIGGIDIVTCASPIAALARCGSEQFDLLLIDHIMPEMDGVEVIRRLRAQPDYRLVPIIMVTSDSDQQLRSDAIGVGATDFINKPFDRNELLARVRNLLALRGAQIELADRANWLARRSRSRPGIWLLERKKSSGASPAPLSIAMAIRVAMCRGWRRSP